ncbi:MAG: GAF domain-containing protein [Actinobacteria bacterium]|nr:GAF domain-containing protein [Actinomycetota bacterium]
MVARGGRDLEQSKRLERGLIRVRWFGVILGVYLVAETNAAPPPYASDTVLVAGQALMAALAGGNLAVFMATRRCRTLPGIERTGLAAFLLDTGVLLALGWLFSYDPKGATWVVSLVLPLEAAIRWRLEGALASVAIVFANEVAREVYMAHRFAEAGIYGGAPLLRYPFLWSNVIFRVGMSAIIALVAGFMARSLAREAENAAQQAARFEESARREAAARRELAAFNTAILAGVEAEDLDRSLANMAGAIGRELDFETLTILLREGDDLLVKGMFGMRFYRDRIPLGTGVTGVVAATGSPLVVPDVSRFPGYIVADPEIRSEMAAPMRIADEVIGVLDVESRRPDAFDEAAIASLTRLADQVALVAHSNQLLSQQRATVERLRELDQMKSDFVGIASHELRTPLAAIRGFTSTLIKNRSRISDEQVMDFVRIIDRQSDRLARLVEDLLLVSRIEAGTIQLQPKDVELRTFLHQAVETFDPEARGRIRLDVTEADQKVSIDADRVDQVLRNLIDNAIKFSPTGTPVVVDAHLEDGTIQVSVTDSGEGIAAEDLPHIFERFHQAEAVLTRQAEGAGLGLYITKRLVEAMGGRIQVSSRPGAGSTFAVTIPQSTETTSAA